MFGVGTGSTGSSEPRYYPEGVLVAVLTVEPVDRLLDYRSPEGGCRDGALVQVPLGPRRVLGAVWGPGQGDLDAERVRRIARALDVPPLGSAMRTFLDRAAAYTLTPRPAMLRLATRAPGLGDPPPVHRRYRLGQQVTGRLTEPRRRVLAELQGQRPSGLTLAELAARANVSAGVVRGLVASGAVIEEVVAQAPRWPHLDPDRTIVDLSPAQEAAAATLREGIASARYGTTLLQGVTGSGKTEVYLEAVATCLRAGRQALVLLPEIALTAEFLCRVEARFGARPAEWHSGITQGERRDAWRAAADGTVDLVVGARSALFLPFRDLGLIVVDEEHDASYKQEEGVHYSARDMAVLRASLCAAQVVLASATPSLESWVNAESGKYRRVVLPARFGTAELPQIEAIDMRAESLPSGRWLSARLVGEVEQRLQAGEQTLLFLNRRGYAPLTLCRACGQQIGCPHCDARMVEHRFRHQLMCHQCGYTMPIPTACPSCGVEGRLTALGPGVERLAEEVAARWPQARVAVLSSDLFDSARALKDQILRIAGGGADIVIGTQLVAKGHNFPLLTLVGVIDADLGLQGSDLRAAEHTFQLMRQVSGRAGRADRRGLALLQTWQPAHPVMQAILSGDEEGFWRAEARERRQAYMPPFARLAGIILSGPQPAPLFTLGQHLAEHDAALARIGAQVFGPAPAPIARIRGRHRVRMLVKADKGAALQEALADWLRPIRLKGGIRLAVDIDPQSFL